MEGGDRKFDFESKKKDSRSMSDLKKAAKTAALSRFQKLSQQNGIKNQKVNGLKTQEDPSLCPLSSTFLLYHKL